MKFLILLLVIVVVGWLALGRRKPPAAQAAKPPARPGPQSMLACAHCALHLPEADAQFDAAGRPYCSEAHRLAGPR